MSLYRQRKGAKPEKPEQSIHFMGRNIFDHVLIRLKAIRSSDLESTLKFLNYKHSCSLLFYVEHYLRQNIEIELAARVALYLIRTYQVQVTQQVDQMRPLLQSVAIHLKYHFRNERETIGVNLAALSILQKQIAEIANNDFEGLF